MTRPTNTAILSDEEIDAVVCAGPAWDNQPHDIARRIERAVIERLGASDAVPAGAILNGNALADRLESYPFESQGGDLRLCSDWVEFRRCFAYLADWVQLNARALTATMPAQEKPAAYIQHLNPDECDLVFEKDDELEGCLYEYQPLYDADALAQAAERGRQQGREEARADSLRLDWLVSEQAIIEPLQIADGFRYRVEWPTLGEWQATWHESPAAAIDAARQPTQKEGA